MTPSTLAGPGKVGTFRMCGVVLETDHPLTTPLVPTSAPPDLHVRLRRVMAPAPLGTPLFTSPICLEDGRPRLALYRLDEVVVLRMTGVADYRLTADAIEVELVDGRYVVQVEVHVLGLAFALWLARRGTIALHGSAASLDDVAVAFLASSGAGKSSLAAALVRSGWGLLSDDLLAIDPRDGAHVVHPCFPQMRMWPDLARQLLGAEADDLSRYHPAYEKLQVVVGGDGFGEYSPVTRPLTAMYVPTRRSSSGAVDVEIERMSPGEALMQLVDGTFGCAAVEALGLQRERLPALAGLLETVPVFALSYPDGFDRLDHVAAVLAAHAGSLSTAC